MAFYGTYINLSVYLTQNVGLADREIGVLLGAFAAMRAWIPVATGALSDRMGFRRSLITSFVLYMFAYSSLVGLPYRVGAWFSVFAMAFAGAFLKPVIPATVRRYSPPSKQSTGFALFYASVNAGSVIGKVLAKQVRTLVSLRASLGNSVVASAFALVLAWFAFFEPAPKEEVAEPGAIVAKAAPQSTLQELGNALKNRRLVGFLLLVSGYYLLIEQFYQTFPTYIVRQFGEDAPREYITLINPLAIATLQVFVARLTKNLPPLPAMATGVFIGSISMALMGATPSSLWGAAGSFFVFAIAEMVYSPRYYEYVSSFAPRGREGMYMGLALVPFGLGGLAGGVLSGRLIAAFLPKDGPRQPLMVWGSYAIIGVLCSLALFAFALRTQRADKTSG